MNEENQKLIELYLQDAKKKKIIFLIVFFIVILLFLFSGYYLKQVKTDNVEDSDVNINEINSAEQENQIIINETTETNENTISEQQPQTNEETIQNTEVAKPQTEIKEEKKVESTPTQSTSTSTQKEETPKPQKPANKDFLFMDGYNMENVSQAAENYLKSSGYSGKCIPLKDDEGIYIGMRVVFD